MRLATKMTLGLVVTSALVIGASGLEQLNREANDLRTTAEHELTILAAALEVAIEQAMRDQQERDIQAIFDGIELRDSSIDVYVFDDDGAVLHQSRESEPHRDVVAPLVHEVREHRKPVLRFVGIMDHVAIAQPLHADDHTRFGILALSKPLDQLRLDLTTTRNAILLSFATQVTAISVVASAIVFFWMRRPLANVARGMRAVRAGDLTARIPAPGKDEVGGLASEFNAMAAELSATRGKLAAETESLRALQEGLQRIDKLVTVGQLSAGLAHEIGSPLQILNGRARAILERADASPEIKRQARIIVAQSERVTHIVQQLLAFARRSSPRMLETDLRDAIRAVLELLELEAHKRQISLELLFEPELPAARADPDRIQQIALNLVNNALKATKPGGRIRVSLGTSRFRHPPGASERPSIRLVVEDDGIGMDERSVAHAFEPFFTTWPDSQGTGLGLAVLKAIVDDHGGLISLASTPGVGTRVEIHLPCTDPPARGMAVPS